MVSEVAEPDYPLEKAVFVRALATGHGRALIHVERYGAEGVQDEILDAALFPKFYDIQCNGYGEEWLARLCTMAGLVDTIISRSHGIAGDDDVLRCRLLKELTLQGHEGARSALREMCRNDEESGDLLGCAEIVEAEGEEGFVFVAERLGERVLADHDYWAESWQLTVPVSVLDEKFGKGWSMAILDRESPANPRLAAYREAVLRSQARDWERQAQPKVSVEPIELIQTSPKREPWLRSTGKNATAEEQLEIAALDFTRMEPVSLENYLNYFQHTGFPELREEHLALLGTVDEKCRWRLHEVLARHAHPQVREAAYEALARGGAGAFVQLLRSSGLEEDTDPLLEAISIPAILEDVDECHQIGSHLLNLVETNRVMTDVRLPLWIYQHGHCLICRYSAVNAMAERSTLSQWVAEECLSEAYETTREVAAKYLGAERSF